MARATGADALTRRLARIASKTPDVASAALYQEAEIEMTEMKARTPVDTSALRNSGHVKPPEVQGREISVSLGFGGPAAPYAVQVHEDLEAFHPVGQAKYAESVLNESRPYLLKRIANRIDLAELAR